MDREEIKRRILESQKKKKETVIASANVDPWYTKFRETNMQQIGFDPSKYNSPNAIPFGYQSWEALCLDIEKYHREVVNVFENIKTPGSIRKPIFYKFRSKVEGEKTDQMVTTLIRIHNIGTPLVSVIECAINGDQDAIKEVSEIMQFGKILPLVYLYSEAKDPKSMTRVKMRTVTKPTMDMLKIRLLWLYRAGYGVSFRDATNTPQEKAE